MTKCLKSPVMWFIWRCGKTIVNYIFKTVTEEKSYNTLIIDGIPCG